MLANYELFRRTEAPHIPIREKLTVESNKIYFLVPKITLLIIIIVITNK